jgi:hypothetical protein
MFPTNQEAPRTLAAERSRQEAAHVDGELRERVRVRLHGEHARAWTTSACQQERERNSYLPLPTYPTHLAYLPTARGRRGPSRLRRDAVMPIRREARSAQPAAAAMSVYSPSFAPVQPETARASVALLAVSGGAGVGPN